MVGHLLCRDSSCHTGKRWLQGVPNKTPSISKRGGALPPSWYSIVRWGDGCPDNQEYDANTGACLSPNGPPNHGPDCSPPSLSVGNPINIATGNKYQSETDYAGPAIAPLLRFTRHYNSSNGLWTHNLSARLTLQSHMVTLHREDGRALDFIRLYDRITSQADNLGRLEKIDGGWRYDEPSGLRLDFDEAGALVELVQASERLRLAREEGRFAFPTTATPAPSASPRMTANNHCASPLQAWQCSTTMKADT